MVLERYMKQHWVNAVYSVHRLQNYDLNIFFQKNVLHLPVVEAEVVSAVAEWRKHEALWDFISITLNSHVQELVWKDVSHKMTQKLNFYTVIVNKIWIITDGWKSNTVLGKSKLIRRSIPSSKTFVYMNSYPAAKV